MRKRRLLSQVAGLCAVAGAATLNVQRALGQASAVADLGQGASTQAMRWVAGELPPYAWNDAHGPTGLAYDLVCEIGVRLHRDVQVEFYPWARALREAREGRNVGVFPVARTPEREALYGWLIPLGKVRQSFFGKPNVDVDHLESLRHARVGVLRGSFTVAALTREGFKHVIGGSDYPELLRMLDRDIVDAVYVTDDNFAFAMRAAGRSNTLLRQGLSLGSVEIYFATSRHCDEAEALRWQQAFRELVADGTVARLGRKYLTPRAR